MVLVKKPNGKIRICGDFVKLNQNLNRKFYPIPDIELELAQIKEASAILDTIQKRIHYRHKYIVGDGYGYQNTRFAARMKMIIRKLRPRDSITKKVISPPKTPTASNPKNQTDKTTSSSL